MYNKAVAYFSQRYGVHIRTYLDRLSIQVTGASSTIGPLFNTTIVKTTAGTYSISSTPELPSFLARHVSGVTGLSNSAAGIVYNGGYSNRLSQMKGIETGAAGYPSPINNGGVQYIYGSDLQVAYDEQSLLNITYPTNEVVATILWAGNNSSGNPVGPFVPADISAYYNATLPSYEPHAKVYGVPVNGAAKPGVSASYDTTGANQENTLDLEMIGSTAPGASIYNVYGPNATFESIDAAFAYILNPNASFSALNNVSVISNSWGGSEFNNSAWYTYLQEAQARGITVLASSGDSGDNSKSSKYTGSQVEFPSAMAYNSFGVTAVGGTTLTLAANLHIQNQTAWYISANDSTDGGPAGSTGGISTVFSEPSWQSNSKANNIINGQGRGVPDISAIANNTLVNITIKGAGPSLYVFWGTSVASPVEAGIVAEIDAVLNHYNQSNVGFLNPLIYSLANKQITPPPITTYTGYIPTGKYNSSLPTLPFYNVQYGRNHVYSATFGYNLVTGWGSIDAYNFTMYVINVNRSGSTGVLKGVENYLSLNGLNVTSYLYNTTTSSYSTVNHYYNASIQQNFFLANQLGAPVFWIQNVIYINGSQTAGWAMNYTGWVIYPFYGQYPHLTLYRYNFPLGKIVTMPHTFDIRSWMSNISVPMGQTMNFEVNSHVLQLPVPGAAFIIDAPNYAYTWQGHNYLNGPYPGNKYPGGLAPQFGLVGGPSGGLGMFGYHTSGNMSSYVLPFNRNSYVSAIVSTFNTSTDQTGEVAENLGYANAGPNNWTLSIVNGSAQQGLVSYAPSQSPTQYNVTFTETGLPSGSLWYVNLSNGSSFNSAFSTITFSGPNGTYGYTVSTVNGYGPSPPTGSFTVNGNTVSKAITYSTAKYTVTFTESGLPSGTWYVNVSGQSGHASAGSSVTLSLTNGSHPYTVATDNKTYHSNGGTIVVNGSSINKTVTFSTVTYTVTFAESGLANGTSWSATFSNFTKSSTGSTISFTESNGTYSYTVAPVSGYSRSLSSGSLTVSGFNQGVSITFTAVTYTVTFTESGLQSGSTWYVNVSGQSGHASAGSSVTLSLTNGSHPYTVATDNKTYHSSGGTVVVNGSSINKTVTFSMVTYNITFTESGLPQGKSWSITLGNSTHSSTGSTISFTEPNGTYKFTVGLVSGYSPSPSYGWIFVNNNSVSAPLSFSPTPVTHGLSPTTYLIIGVIFASVLITSAVIILRRRSGMT